MAKKKRKLSAEFGAELEASSRETVQLLEKRIAYHKAKLAEQHARARA